METGFGKIGGARVRGIELELFKEAFPSTFNGSRARFQVFKTGSWQHPSYGRIKITQADLYNMKNNFDRGKRALVVDYDHGTDVRVTPEQRIAAGWIESAEVVGDGLYVTAKMTERAAKRIRDGEYRMISPTWTPDFISKETGRSMGITLLRAALTNTPFIDGMHPAVPLSERAIAVFAESAEPEVGGAVGELKLLIEGGQGVDDALRPRPDLNATEPVPSPDDFEVLSDWLEIAVVMLESHGLSRSAAYANLLNDAAINDRYRKEMTPGLHKDVYARVMKIKRDRGSAR
jgi:hypothetical protein